MIAMHYRFTLPADYDMALIEQRIASNGAHVDQIIKQCLTVGLGHGMADVMLTAQLNGD